MGAIMKSIGAISILLFTIAGPQASFAQDVVPPEVVRFENMHIDGDVKIVTVGNANRHYSLICNIKADSCITPERGKNYLLFNKNTRWKMPSYGRKLVTA